MPTHDQSTTNTHSPFGITGGTSKSGLSQSNACYSCQKPLPRCVICNQTIIQFSGINSFVNTSQNIGNHTAWCMKCKHTGHVNHLLSWFESNLTCPATDCDCCCMDQ